MKPIAKILLLLSLSWTATAQKSNRSSIQFRLSDGQPLMISLNNRDFKTVNRQITVGDLPGKRQYVKVYRFIPNSNGNGGQANIVYSGTFRTKPGFKYDAIVDVNRRKLSIKELGQVNFEPNSMPPPPMPNSQGSNAIDVENPDFSLSGKLIYLKQQMDKETADTKKLELVKEYIQKNKVSSSDLKKIAPWIMFDDNKMNLLKYAHSYLIDSQNFYQLKEVFTLPEAQNEFEKYVSSLNK